MMERKLVRNIVRYLTKKGYRTAVEVPFLSRSIDIVYRTRTGEIVAIEVKMTDWKRALNQAKYCLLGASRVYICLPERTLMENTRSKIRSMGIGLIHADRPSNGRKAMRFVIGATRNQVVDKHCRRILKAAFLNKSEGES
jgi:hypothetical protein